MDNNLATSYFGFINNTFYAGPNGASFQIKSRARFSSYQALLQNNDPQILVGDYLIVNYGDQNHPDVEGEDGTTYNSNVDRDNSPWDSSLEDSGWNDDIKGYYNATLWQKVKTSGTRVEQYDLIFQCVSAAPNITINNDTPIDPGAIEGAFIIEKVNTNNIMNQQFNFHPINAWDFNSNVSVTSIDPGNNPQATISNATASTKQLNLSLPKPWNIETSVTPIAPNGTPSAEIVDATGVHANTHKQLNLSLPSAWKINENVSVTSINPGLLPAANFETSADTKTLNLSLPSPWGFQVVTSPVGSEDVPNVTITSASGEDENKKKVLTFSLPSATAWAEPEINILGENEQASISIPWVNENENPLKTRKLVLSIPGGTKVVCGSLLNSYGRADAGATAESNNPIFASFKTGDLYISTKSGTVWKMIGTESNSNPTVYNFVSQGVVQLPKPAVSLTVTNPYDETGNPVSNLEATTTYDNTTGWNLTLPVLKAPKITSSIEIVPSNYSGTDIGINSTYNAEGIAILGKIPKGSQIITGSQNNISSSPHVSGDYYLATEDFTLYRYTERSYEEVGNLSGKPFQIVGNSIILQETDLAGYSDETIIGKIKQYLVANYTGNNAPEERREFLSVIYRDVSGSDTVDTTYWAYRIASREYEVIRVSASSGSSIISNTNPMDINTDSVDNGDFLAFSINSILSLKKGLNTKITTNSDNIDSIQSDLAEALNNRVTEAQVTTKIEEALTWGTWGLEGQNYVLRKGTTVITNG